MVCLPAICKTMYDKLKAPRCVGVLQSVEKVFHWDILLLYHSALTMIIGYR